MALRGDTGVCVVLFASLGGSHNCFAVFALALGVVGDRALAGASVGGNIIGGALARVHEMRQQDGM